MASSQEFNIVSQRTASRCFNYCWRGNCIDQFGYIKYHMYDDEAKWDF